jgi:phosphate starvation-inducible PhoH-like protein
MEKEPKQLKNPIKFNIELNDEQKIAKEIILNNDIIVLYGLAGSGKTLLACQTGFDLLFRRKVDKVIITRPTVSDEDLGFMPGDMKEKLDPWLKPIYDNFNTVYKHGKSIDEYIKNGEIEISPISFLRGRTFTNSLIIADEVQNLTHKQWKTLLTRLGIGSKLILCGDSTQTDLKNSESGMEFVMDMCGKVEGMALFELVKNHRHPIVELVLNEYKTFERGSTIKS